MSRRMTDRICAGLAPLAGKRFCKRKTEKDPKRKSVAGFLKKR
jgi:hypothetical protein